MDEHQQQIERQLAETRAMLEVLRGLVAETRGMLDEFKKTTGKNDRQVS